MLNNAKRDGERISAKLKKNIFHPQALANTPVMSHDPLPPPDTICGYTRPKSTTQPPADSSNILTTFFRSLLPNYNPDPAANPAR